MKIKITPWHGLQNRCHVSRMKTTWILYISFRALRCSGALLMSSNILKFSVNHVVDRYPVIYTLFHLQSTGSVYLAEFLTVLTFSKWQMRTDFSFKSAAALAPNKRVRQSFEALKRSTDFFSLTVKDLNSIFLQYKDVLSSLKICCLVKTS